MISFYFFWKINKNKTTILKNKFNGIQLYLNTIYIMFNGTKLVMGT